MTPAVPLKTWVAIVGSTIGTFMAIINIQIVGASIGDIQGAIGAGTDDGAWISTVYLVAEIVTIPSAFTFPTGAAHWEPLMRARAIENQVYVIAPNQIGRTPRGGVDYGNSMIVDPWGTIIARAPDQEAVITAEIDRDYLSQVRRQLPCLTHIKFAR